jgi:hypothetical protein
MVVLVVVVPVVVLVPADDPDTCDVVETNCVLLFLDDAIVDFTGRFVFLIGIVLFLLIVLLEVPSLFALDEGGKILDLVFFLFVM